MNNIRLLLLSTFLCCILITSGCLGEVTSDGPPSQYNVTFDEPTTGTVFSNLSYSSNQHGQLIYNVENVSNRESLDSLQVYWQNDGTDELFYHRNITSEYIDFGIGAPIDQSDPPERYQIRAWNETAGVLDKINVTIRNEGGGGLFP